MKGLLSFTRYQQHCEFSASRASIFLSNKILSYLHSLAFWLSAFPPILCLIEYQAKPLENSPIATEKAWEVPEIIDWMCTKLPVSNYSWDKSTTRVWDTKCQLWTLSLIAVFLLRGEHSQGTENKVCSILYVTIFTII